MKKSLWMAAVLGSCVLGMIACKKAADTTAPGDATKKTETAPTAAAMKAEDISDALSKAVCGRMVACNQNAGVSEADCATGMSKDLVKALPEKAKTISKATLDSCVAAIGKATCEELSSPNPPAGCDFME